MPTTRRRVPRPLVDVITPVAAGAWRYGDFFGLARTLQIKPWQMHPWPLRLTALGCDPRRAPEDSQTPFGASWRRAAQLQAALLEVAGEPPAKLVER
jgi:hypothetical protein